MNQYINERKQIKDIIQLYYSNIIDNKIFYDFVGILVPYFPPWTYPLLAIPIPPVSLPPTYIPSFLTLPKEHIEASTSYVECKRIIKKFKPQRPILPLVSYPIYSQPSILG